MFNPEDYEPVATRLDRWLKANEGNCQVLTEMLSVPGADICVIKTCLYVDGVLLATGHAEEVRGSGNVNRTSSVENCETSSIGRALANLGLSGSDPTKRPSREEMSKVQRPALTAGAPIDRSGPLTVKGKQHGVIPQWAIMAAQEQGIVLVYDNRDTVAGTKRPWFKCAESGTPIWPPRGTPEPVLEAQPERDEMPEEPF